MSPDTQDQRLRDRLDIIIACFTLTSLGLVNAGAAFVVYLIISIGNPAPYGLQLWFGISVLTAIAFGITADVVLLTSKILLYRLFRRLDQPIK